MVFSITEKQMLLLHAANAANQTGIISALLDQVELEPKIEDLVAAACTAAVTADRTRIYDLFLTTPIEFPVGICTDEEEIDQCIKLDRFKLMSAVRDGMSFQEVINEIKSRFDAEEE